MISRLRSEPAELNRSVSGASDRPLPWGRGFLFAIGCSVVLAIAGGLFALVLNWLAPGYYSGVFPDANRIGQAAVVGVDTGIFQGLVLGLIVGAAVAVGLGKFAQLDGASCGRVLAMLCGCAALFTVGGGLVGLALGSFMPDYYRGVVSGGRQPNFNPVDVGVGLGSSQGAILGVVVGAIIAAGLAWRKSRGTQLSSS